MLRIKATQDEESVASNFHDYAPKFVWLARNFKVKWLKGPNGGKLTPNEYLEGCLAPEAGYGEAATKRNMLRMYMESYFPVRDCVALSRAVEGNGTEPVEPGTARSDLRSQFVDTVDDVYANYLSEKAQHLPPKGLMGHGLRSEQFVAALDAYVEAMNSNQLPTMQKASNSLLEQEITQVFEMAKQTYKTKVNATRGFESGGEFSKGQDKAADARELQIAHLRGVQTAMAHIREVRSNLPENLQKTLFKDNLAQWGAQVKRDFQDTLDRNTKLSAEICTKILERVLPQNLEAMATELSARSREDFSDGLIRLLTQYKSDLRSALDEYAQQSNGPAVDTCLEEALTQSVCTSIQKWGTMVLRQYQTHMRSWQEEHAQLESAYELAQTQDADTTCSTNEHKRLHEEQLAQATQELSDLRRVLHSELNAKKSELERLTSEISTMNLKHDMRVKNAESDLAWSRSRTEDLEKTIVAERQRKEEASSGSAKRVLEKERSFHQEERSLLVEQKELMAQTVGLEREFVQKKTKHVQKVFALQNDHAKKVDGVKAGQSKFERQLKSQAKKDLRSLKLAHEKEKKVVQAESTALDKELAAIQDKLAVLAAEQEADRASAAANRDFFKSLPMIPLPLMQAPAAAAGEEQPARRASLSSKAMKPSAPSRSVSFDDTSTSSASPITRADVPQSNDMCRQS
ncbi:hypothetical protein BBO99_00005895 [Phytophthora kernoviae]|uniref:Guanylate-binding protein N-terminal domain-containing protein n=2 Tax=Phytophthora kernoviae TaxID=325452 RepID=A0A421FHY6_9STRA|nr:hypothetical protein G195_006434 [Phytophthora kernoviae 00238/432]KAG2522890.1 hypothetical protein JM16_005512 [Phytophthora kernoviae]KAG2524534.1 hypothetical protein JM18_005355 [Phytophthora kernoviae]RLN45323.1 hypothetical protein BBI17_005952 [Phytophthora kernoviae]RLN78544.1 hypothetical protein BBO99_00005895 [Phytophthora kernoviae]